MKFRLFSGNRFVWFFEMAKRPPSPITG
jgi:hypothetical protein